jgi:hypothetical protein
MIRFLLFLFALVFCVFSARVLAEAKTPIHEVQALILLIIAVLFGCSACICDAIVKMSHRLEKRKDK